MYNELYNLYSLPNTFPILTGSLKIIRVIKARRVLWEAHVACAESNKNAHKNLV
jgi:hypothetical protein